MEPNITSLSQRLETLEKQNRRLRVSAALALVLVTCLILMGQSGQGVQTLKAQKFIVVDAAGKVKAFLGTDADGDPELVLNDANEKKRVALYIVSHTHIKRPDGGVLTGLTLPGWLVADGDTGHPQDMRGPPRLTCLMIRAAKTRCFGSIRADLDVKLVVTRQRPSRSHDGDKAARIAKRRG